MSKVRISPIKEMGVAKKGRGNNFQNCSTSSKVLYGCQLVISDEKSFLARSATIIPFGPLLFTGLSTKSIANISVNQNELPKSFLPSVLEIQFCPNMGMGVAIF